VHVLETARGEDEAHAPRHLVEAARHVLAEAVAAASSMTDRSVEVSEELLCDGSVADQLADGADEAAVIVLQHRTLGRAPRTVVRSMVPSIAGRVPVPVAQVPAGWRPGGDGTGVVTIAIQHPVEDEAVLRTGLERAGALAARVVVLHAWWLTTGFDGIDVRPGLRLPWEAHTRIELDSVLMSLQDGLDGLPVTLDLRYAPPIEAVLDATARSDLLVLGRRHSRFPARTHLGPVASAALLHAVCPVWLAPEASA
jgi:hypothetical protein